VLTNRNWGGQPFPGKHGDAFGKNFAAFHTESYGQAVYTGTVAIQAAIKAMISGRGMKSSFLLIPGRERWGPSY
jgi:hypothetical protein